MDGQLISANLSLVEFKKRFESEDYNPTVLSFIGELKDIFSNAMLLFRVSMILHEKKLLSIKPQLFIIFFIKIACSKHFGNHSVRRPGSNYSDKNYSTDQPFSFISIFVIKKIF